MLTPQTHAINKTIANYSPLNNALHDLSKQSNQVVRQQILSPDQLFTRLNHINGSKNNYENQQSLQTEQIGLINSNGIVKRYQLLLIILLILASIASVKYSTDGSFYHVKNIRNYFNSKLLGNDVIALYEYGNNIDQSFQQFAIFSDIQQHFDNVVEVIDNFTDIDGFTLFQNQRQQNVQVQIYYLDESQLPFKGIMATDEFEFFLLNLQKKDFLLGLKEMVYTISFGSNKKVLDLNLTASYTISSSMLMNVKLQIQYEPNQDEEQNFNNSTIRVVEQVLAFLLLSSYLHNAYKIIVENQYLKLNNMFSTDVQFLQRNRAYWCYSLVMLNLITIFNQTLAPLASFLQLLPILQRHDSAHRNQYNFNTNLRYALPLVFRIFIPVVIFLNGFIFYSMLMYPGDYFEGYTKGFFSYVYQNFQVGTYEIFTQLQDRGNFAYVLYGVLYFYMVLVGNNLIPALFCTMIYIKMYEKDLAHYISKTIKSAVCPNCSHVNFKQAKQEDNHFQLTINSPTISPYLKGKVSTLQPGKGQVNLLSKVVKMYVEDQDAKQKSKNQYLKNKIEKIQRLVEKIQNVVKSKPVLLNFLKENQKKITQFILIL